MMFDSHHYVPVLKVKRGEKTALTLISSTLRPRITPLLEIVERTDKTLTKHLDTAFKGLAASAGLYARCFLDTREISGDGENAARAVFERASAEGIVFTPVTGISRYADVEPALEYGTDGIALRITTQEFDSGTLSTMTEDFMDSRSLEPEDVDLVVDLGSTESLIADGIATLTAAVVADIPYLDRWRTFTVSASAFPKSMGVVGKNSYGIFRREEWVAWRDYLYANRGELARLPAFSDCAIQHPSGVEGFDPILMQVSASVRYTHQDDWLLIKGESTRLIPPSQQFPILAARLVYGDLQPYFLGSGHCAGCESIKAAADGAPKLGSAEAWRRLGTIHHLSMAMQGLDSLPWP